MLILTKMSLTGSSGLETEIQRAEKSSILHYCFHNCYLAGAVAAGKTNIVTLTLLMGT